jgi:hypothetical protein
VLFGWVLWGLNALRGDLRYAYRMSYYPKMHNKGDLRYAYRMTYCTKMDKRSSLIGGKRVG